MTNVYIVQLATQNLNTVYKHRVNGINTFIEHSLSMRKNYECQ